MSKIVNEQVETAPRAGTGTPFSVWLALVIGLGVAFSWHFPSGWMVVAGIILIVAAWCMLIRPQKRLTLVIVLFIIAILIAVALPNTIRITEKAQNAELKQNLHAIQLGLERYAADYDGRYPLVIGQLRHDYMTEMPRSPFTYRRFGYPETDKYPELRQMQPLGEDFYPEKYKTALNPVGNFCYVPRLAVGPDGELTATGYLLLAFGQKRWHPDWTTPPRDIPLVLIQLTESDEVPAPY